MATVHKLVIIRAAKATDEMLAAFTAEFGAKLNAEVVQPIAILPRAWHEQNDPSHKGFVLSGLMLKDVRDVEAFEKATPIATVYDLKATTDQAIDDALATTGLRIHPLIERTAQGT